MALAEILLVIFSPAFSVLKTRKKRDEKNKKKKRKRKTNQTKN